MWRTLAVVVALAGTAAAQPQDPPQPPPPPSDPASGPAIAPEMPVVAPVAAPGDAAWAAYDDAFGAAAAGDVDAAKAKLQAVVAAYPGHPAAQRAAELLLTFVPKANDPNAPSKLARGEIAFWSTVGGVFMGINVCTMIDCKSDRAYAAVYMLTVGGSLATSVLLTRHGIRQGEAQLYNSAQTWGSWNALAINNGWAETRSEAEVSLGGQAIGLGAGLALWQTWRPTTGDVALTNTFWVWGSVLTTFAELAAGREPTFRSVVAAGDVALAAGAIASTQIKMSRGRTLLIDVGGVLGLLGGALIATNTDTEEGAGTSFLIGTGLGLTLSTVLSKDWDAPPIPVAPGPIAGSRSVGVGLVSGFSF